ncbi:MULTISPECIES: response regulator [unclassified Dehalobacter]|uniref:LytR/AlgR family response regulator transcription factor n=1 Tax=unclassified Dehalobacter TaxID=2635733 RepID=UPI0018F3AB33|nr:MULTISPECIES: response regulator [unclassified Dehalobacter]
MINIAICDDMPILREVLAEMIHTYEAEKNIKFNLCEFGSGEELLETFDRDKKYFDVFFLDNRMKKLTGVDIALHVRQYDRDCHIVFVTASDTQYAFMSAAPLKILRKPAQKEDVYKILDFVSACASENG